MISTYNQLVISNPKNFSLLSSHLEFRIDKMTTITTIINIILMILLHRIDELEDEIIREKLKINAVSGQLDDTFDEMLSKY